jgi:hypothetical protein
MKKKATAEQMDRSIKIHIRVIYVYFIFLFILIPYLLIFEPTAKEKCESKGMDVVYKGVMTQIPFCVERTSDNIE